MLSPMLCLFFLKQRVQPILQGDDADPEGAAESAAHRRVRSVVEHEERLGKVGIPESLPGNEAELREGARALQPGSSLCRIVSFFLHALLRISCIALETVDSCLCFCLFRSCHRKKMKN